MLERFTVHCNPENSISKLLILVNSKNLRTIRKLIAYENFQVYSSFFCTVKVDHNLAPEQNIEIIGKDVYIHEHDEQLCQVSFGYFKPFKT